MSSISNIEITTPEEYTELLKKAAEAIQEHGSWNPAATLEVGHAVSEWKQGEKKVIYSSMKEGEVKVVDCPLSGCGVVYAREWNDGKFWNGRKRQYEQKFKPGYYASMGLYFGEEFCHTQPYEVEGKNLTAASRRKACEGDLLHAVVEHMVLNDGEADPGTPWPIKREASRFYEAIVREWITPPCGFPVYTLASVERKFPQPKGGFLHKTGNSLKTDLIFTSAYFPSAVVEIKTGAGSETLPAALWQLRDYTLAMDEAGDPPCTGQVIQCSRGKGLVIHQWEGDYLRSLTPPNDASLS